MPINIVGALISFTVLMILILTKFHLVWPVFVFMPIVLLIFHSIKKHYLSVGEQLRLMNETEPVEIKGNVVIVPIAGVTRVVEQSVQYAKSLSEQVIAVHVSFDKEKDKKIEADWEKLNSGVRLVILHSSYRSLIHPLDKFLETVEAKANAHQYKVMVLVPQFIPKKDGIRSCITNLPFY